MTKPITYYGTYRPDNEVMDQISLKYGSTLDTLSYNQKFALLSLLSARFCSPESLPADLTTLACELSQDGGLALIEAVTAQLRSKPARLRGLENG